MTLRTNLTARQRFAHFVLDQVRAGLPMPESRIRWALLVLGDVE